jgi:hypothetical protein
MQSPSLTTLKANSYIDEIRIKISNKLNSGLKTYLMIAIPILILMVYFIFKYRFNSRTINAVANMNYKNQLTLSNLPICSNIDKSMQYKLCDYYISSSYMTPCVGNQHYDYVSIDMITEIIQSGARYIQIPICESDVGANAIPVVATAQYGQKLITSLNTLDIRATLNAIRSNAFNINNNKINYPLFIHLVLNTSNPFTLGILADTIKEVLNDKLSSVSTYTTFPIFLEKLCNLLGKIILIATPEYVGTKLEPYIVPINTLYESYYYGDLDGMTNSAESAYTNTYNNKLSTKQQIKSNMVFKSKYPSLDYVINNSSTVGASILEDKDILNNLTNFNKVGMTLIKPHQPNDVISANYDPTSAVYNGCQWISMNFQINDDHMKNYLKIFKTGSFVVKPASMRFSEQEEPIPDLLQVYKAISPTDSRVVNQIYYNNNNLLIALESYSQPSYYLTQIESNLRFNLGSNMTQDKFGTKTYSIGINQCFLINKSTVSMGTADIPMFLISPSYNNYLLTQTENTFDLEEQKKLKTDIYLQSYVFERSVITDSNDESFYMIRTIAKQNSMYLANQNKIPKTYAYTATPEAQNNMSFRIHIIPFKIQITIKTLFDGSMKTMAGGIVGILENNSNAGTKYILEPSSGNNFNYLKDQFYMRNAITNTYLMHDLNTFYLYDRNGRAGSNGMFTLRLNNGFYSLYNSAGQVLILFQNNLIKFIDEDEVKTNENLFKININYVLI